MECLKIYENYLLAGTKDGLLFVLEKSNLNKVKVYSMEDEFFSSNVRSECPSLRAIDILNRKLIVGTFGAEIYEL